jgi:histone H3/H4
MHAMKSRCEWASTTADAGRNPQAPEIFSRSNPFDRFQKMTSDNMRRRVFRRLLAREAGTDADARAIAAAARRLCERFAQQVTPLIGDAGVAAICARSLHLTQQQFPSLAPLHLSDHGDAPFTRVQLALEQQQPAVACAAAVAVLTTVGDVLASFIGERLTTRLLREAWPDGFAGDTAEETNR